MIELIWGDREFRSEQKLSSKNEWEMQFDIDLSSRNANHSEGVALWFSPSKLKIENRKPFIYGYDPNQATGKYWVLIFHSVDDQNNSLYVGENDDAIIFYQSVKTGLSKRTQIRQEPQKLLVPYKLMNSTSSFKLVYKGNTLMLYSRDPSSQSFVLLFSQKELSVFMEEFYFGISGSTGNSSSQSITFKELKFISDKDNNQIRSIGFDDDVAIDIFGVKQALGETSQLDKYDAMYNNMTLEQIDNFLGKAQVILGF